MCACTAKTRVKSSLKRVAANRIGSGESGKVTGEPYLRFPGGGTAEAKSERWRSFWGGTKVRTTVLLLAKATNFFLLYADTAADYR